MPVFVFLYFAYTIVIYRFIYICFKKSVLLRKRKTEFLTLLNKCDVYIFKMSNNIFKIVDHKKVGLNAIL